MAREQVRKEQYASHASPGPSFSPRSSDATRRESRPRTHGIHHAGDRHWEFTARLGRQTIVRGKQFADAQHAALAIEYACQWVTRDDDFGGFAPFGLEWEHLAPVPEGSARSPS